MVQSYKLKKMFYIPLTPVYLLIKSLPAHISEFYKQALYCTEENADYSRS